MRHVKATRLADCGDDRFASRDAVGIGDAVDPFRHACTQRLQWTVSVDRASVNGTMLGKVVRGCRYEDVASPKSNGRAIAGVKFFPFDRPRRSGIAANAQTPRRRRNRDVGPVRVRADLMNVAIDIDRRPPG